MPHRRLTIEQRDRIIAKIARLHSLARWHPSFVRLNRVANRLAYWLADVQGDANWAALYDCIEKDYARCRVSYGEAIDRLRWLGIDARMGFQKFPIEVEIARRHCQQQLRQTSAFNAVTWELAFNRRNAGSNG